VPFPTDNEHGKHFIQFPSHRLSIDSRYRFSVKERQRKIRAFR